MRALLQRVSRASVTVEGRSVGTIESGLLVLAGIKKGDSEEDAAWLGAAKITGLRIFPDESGRMNRSVAETGGAVLLVSQFTLYGDARKGRRPSFESAARPEDAVPLLAVLQRMIEAAGPAVATGEFGAHMVVELVNDGPVTLMLDTEERRRARAAAKKEPSTGRLALLGPDSPLRRHTLVLASASPRRRDLLRDLGLEFALSPPDVDESVDIPEDPAECARVLAERKARAVAFGDPDAIVLAADTIVTRNGRFFGKPRDDDDAVRMLTELSGREHCVLTGVCVARAASETFLTRVASTRVRFRAAGEKEIRRYVETREPFGKAGAYAIQGLGGLLVAGIEGDYSNVVGLPVGTTLDLLEEVIS